MNRAYPSSGRDLRRRGRRRGRMGFGYYSGRDGTFAYFFCPNRHTGRSTCDLPYLQEGSRSGR